MRQSHRNVKANSFPLPNVINKCAQIKKPLQKQKDTIKTGYIYLPIKCQDQRRMQNPGTPH